MTSEDLRRRNASLHDRIEQVLEMHPELRDLTETIALNQDLHVEVGAPFLERTRDKLLERMQAITKGRPELEHYFDDIATAVAFPETTSRETSSRPQSAPTWRCVLRLIEKLNRTQSKIAFWLCAVGIVAIGATRLGSGTVVIFAFCCLTAFALLNEALGSRFEGVSKLGDLTYASYLLHFPIQVAFVLVLDRLGVSRDVFFSPLALIVFMVVTFGLSWVVFHGFEMPAQNQIRALSLRREPRTPSARRGSWSTVRSSSRHPE
jgi:hypothetical protein